MLRDFLNRFFSKRRVDCICLISAISIALLGCTSVPPPDSPQDLFNTTLVQIPAPTQFNREDALAFIEFCINLDSQDDLHPVKPPKNISSKPDIYRMREDRIKGWEITPATMDSRVRIASEDPLVDKYDPTQNGFGPFNTAWTLWHKSGTTTWALVFRGTVFSNVPTVKEDVLLTTVAARNGLAIGKTKLPATFAVLPRAEVHEGFAYGAVSALFYKKNGALSVVREMLPPGSTLILVGHSQGAAVAVLAHALLYYAQNPPDGGDPFSMKDRHYVLQSYTFAQPRPGNVQFALDFARITNGGATSFALNNTIDPVTMVPTTHSFTVGAFEDSPNNKNWGFMRTLNDGLNALSRAWNRGLQTELHHMKDSDKDIGKYDFQLEQWGVINPGPTPKSQNYATAGNIIPLIGHTNKAVLGYYNDRDDQYDEFIQHHATTYRRLLEELFHVDQTTQDYMAAQQPKREQ